MMPPTEEERRGRPRQKSPHMVLRRACWAKAVSLSKVMDRRSVGSMRAKAASMTEMVSAAAQGKIERWHQTLKNRILLENYYYLPGDLAAHIARFVEHYYTIIGAITRA